MPIDKIKQVKDDYFPHYDFNNIDDPVSPLNTIEDSQYDGDDTGDGNEEDVTDLFHVKTVPMKLSLHPGYGGETGAVGREGGEGGEEEEEEEDRGGPIGEIEHGGKSSFPPTSATTITSKKKESPESVDRYQSTSNPAYRTKQQTSMDNSGEIRESDPRFEDGGSFEDYHDEDDENDGEDMADYDYDYHDFTHMSSSNNAPVSQSVNRGKGKPELRSNSHSPPPSGNSSSGHNNRGSDSSTSPPRSSSTNSKEGGTKKEKKVKKGNDRFSYRDSVLETSLGQEFDDDGQVVISRP
jgi:hypothetical protein